MLNVVDNVKLVLYIYIYKYNSILKVRVHFTLQCLKDSAYL